MNKINPAIEKKMSELTLSSSAATNNCSWSIDELPVACLSANEDCRIGVLKQSDIRPMTIDNKLQILKCSVSWDSHHSYTIEIPFNVKTTVLELYGHLLCNNWIKATRDSMPVLMLKLQNSCDWFPLLDTQLKLTDILYN